MGKCGRFVGVSLLFYLGFALYSTYQTFAPSYCKPTAGEKCYGPLWPEDQRIDLYVYSSPEQEYSFDRLTPVRASTQLYVRPGLRRGALSLRLGCGAVAALELDKPKHGRAPRRHPPEPVGGESIGPAGQRHG